MQSRESSNVVRRKPNLVKSNFMHSETVSSSRNFEFCEVKELCNACPMINNPYKKGLYKKYDLQLSELKKNKFLGGTKFVGVTSASKNLAHKNYSTLTLGIDQTGDLSPKVFLKDTKISVNNSLPNLSFCPTHARVIGKFIRDLQKQISELGIDVYDPKRDTGALKELTIRGSHITEELMVVFHVTTDISNQLKRLSKIIRASDQYNLSSVSMINESLNGRDNNENLTKIAGSEKLRESLCDLNFEISPMGAFPYSPSNFSSFYRRIEQLGGFVQNKVAWDIFSDFGIASMLMARSGYKVLATECNPRALVDLSQNLRRNNLVDRVEVLTHNTEHALLNIPKWAHSPSLIVCKAPAEGISKQLSTQLRLTMNNSKPILIYLSSNLETMINDLTELCDSGLKVRQTEAFDLYPQTNQLEWLSILTK